MQDSSRTPPHWGCEWKEMRRVGPSVLGWAGAQQSLHSAVFVEWLSETIAFTHSRPKVNKLSSPAHLSGMQFTSLWLPGSASCQASPFTGSTSQQTPPPNRLRLLPGPASHQAPPPASLGSQELRELTKVIHEPWSCRREAVRGPLRSQF